MNNWGQSKNPKDKGVRFIFSAVVAQNNQPDPFCWAAIFGEMDASLSQVILQTELGGERMLEELEDDPLPRIC